MVVLKLLGRAALERDGAVITGPPSQRHRLGLLALLASSPTGALTREKLMALLWPERGTESARKLLNQSVYVLRQAAGTDAIVTAGEEVRLETGAIHCDVVAFEDALDRGDPELAVEQYSGPFLDGFFLPGAMEFEHWAEGERRRLAAAYAKALEELAEAAEARGDAGMAVEWWRARAAQDPHDSRAALRFMTALAAFGNPGGAIKHATAHLRLLDQDLGVPPPSAVVDLAERLRREGPWAFADEPGARSAPTGHGSGPGPSKGEAPTPAGGERRAGGKRRRWFSARARLSAAVLAVVGLLAVIGLLVAAWLVVSPSDAPTSADAFPAAVGTHSIAAYEYYLRATDPTLLRSTEAARDGLEFFHRAIALDSTYASAWAGLTCLALRVSTGGGPGPPRDRLRALAEEAAVRAVALDDSLAAAHAALGLVRMRAFDFRAAEARLNRAIDLDPDGIRARHWLMNVYLWTGRPAAALAEAERAVRLDPLSPTATAELARALAANGHCDEALTRLEPLRALDPPLLRVAPIAVRCHTETGRWEDAVALLRAEVDRDGSALSMALLGYALGRGERRDEAVRIRTELLRRWREGGDALPVAMTFAGLGELDQAFRWLALAIEDGSLTGLPVHFQVVDILAGSLRGDPRFGELRTRLHLSLLPRPPAPRRWG